MAESPTAALSPAGPHKAEAPVLPIIEPAAGSGVQAQSSEAGPSSQKQHSSASTAVSASAVASKVDQVFAWFCCISVMLY